MGRLRSCLNATLLCILIAVAIGACKASSVLPASSSGPTEIPIEPVAELAGTWVGTLESANLGVQPITMTIVQAGGCVDGTWSSSTNSGATVTVDSIPIQRSR